MISILGEHRKPKIFAILSAAVSTGVLASGANAWYYADDFGVIPSLEGGGLSNFVSSVGAGFYRPLQSMALELQIELFGWSTIPLHLVAIFLHLLCGVAVYYWTRKFSDSEWGGMIAASLFFLSPIAVYPVLGNDTLSQVGATVFGFIGFVAGSDTHHEQSGWRGGLAGGALTCALFFKETAVVYPFLLAGFILWRSWERGKVIKGVLLILRRRKNIWLGATLVAGVVLYLLLRFLGTHLSVGTSSNYAFSANPVYFARNVLMTLGGMAVGGSYVEILQNLRSGRWLALASPVLLSVAWMGTMIWGAWKSRKGWAVIVTLLLSVFAMGPILFMKFRPSPLYLYGGLPFFASAAGIGVAGFFDRRRVQPKVIVGGIMILFFFLQASGSHRLVNLMVENGKRAKLWFDCVDKLARKAEEGSSIAVFLRGKEGGPFTASSEDRVARGAIGYIDRRYDKIDVYEVEDRDVESLLIDFDKCSVNEGI